MHVFWQRGYEGTSLSVLLSEMGIGKKSLYDTYGNKRELFLQALELYSEQSLSHLREKLNRAGSPLANVQELFQSFGEESCKGCFLGNNMADFDLQDEEVAGRFCRHMKAFENALVETLEKAQSQGELSASASPREIAQMLNCLSQGIALESRVGRCPSRRDTALATVFKLMRTR